MNISRVPSTYRWHTDTEAVIELIKTMNVPVRNSLDNEEEQSFSMLWMKHNDDIENFCRASEELLKERITKSKIYPDEAIEVEIEPVHVEENLGTFSLTITRVGINEPYSKTVELKVGDFEDDFTDE